MSNLSRSAAVEGPKQQLNVQGLRILTGSDTPMILRKIPHSAATMKQRPTASAPPYYGRHHNIQSYPTVLPPPPPGYFSCGKHSPRYDYVVSPPNPGEGSKKGKVTFAKTPAGQNDTKSNTCRKCVKVPASYSSVLSKTTNRPMKGTTEWMGEADVIRINDADISKGSLNRNQQVYHYTSTTPRCQYHRGTFYKNA